MELKAFTTMLTQLGDLRVACGPMEINRRTVQVRFRTIVALTSSWYPFFGVESVV